MEKAQAPLILPTSYKIGSLVLGEDYAGPYLAVTLAEIADPMYLREDFADHVAKFLEKTNPELLYYPPQRLPGGQLSVIGYDLRRKARIRVNVNPGQNRQTEVIIQPTINPDGFLERYKGVLERDLVSG